MDRPYIIWTFRRTGGTTLASILAKLSSHKTIPHEPFNPDRLHGAISKELMENGNIRHVRRAISDILGASPVIKHCFELVPMQLNAVLLQESLRLGYNQVVLKRKSEVDRLYSLEVASQTGAWGPDSAKEKYRIIQENDAKSITLKLRPTLLHMSECYLRMRWLMSELKRQKCDFAAIDFEDLYQSPEIGMQKVNYLLQFLGHDSAKMESMRTFISDKLTSGNQDSNQIENQVKNALQWRRAVRENFRALHHGDSSPE